MVMNRDKLKQSLIKNTFTRFPLPHLPRQHYDVLVTRILTKHE
jgi:hypothetical protein